MPQRDPATIGQLERAGVPYMITGSVASSYHGGLHVILARGVQAAVACGYPWNAGLVKIGSIEEAESARPDLESIVRAWCDWRES